MSVANTVDPVPTVSQIQALLEDPTHQLRVGLIGAMEEEVALLRAQLQDREDHRVSGYEFYTGQLAGQEVVLLKSGIGKVNAAIGTTLMLERFAPSCVINTGSAGGFAADLRIGDLVISSEVRHHDFDLTVFGYEPGQVPQMPAAFKPDPLLMEIAERSIGQVEEVQTVQGLIATGDSFMNCPVKVAETRSRFPQMQAAEMEAAAIAQTCFQAQVPFIVIRALSDIAGQESSLSFKEFLDQAGGRSARMVMGMVKALGALRVTPPDRSHAA